MLNFAIVVKEHLKVSWTVWYQDPFGEGLPVLDLPPTDSIR